MLIQFQGRRCFCALWACILIELVPIVFPEPIHDVISTLSDRVNEIKRALIDIHNQPRMDITSPLITDPFVSRDPRQVRFLLYDKRLSPEEHKEIKRDLESFKNVRFERKKPVKILVHGFNHNSTDGDPSPGSFPLDAKNAFLEHTDHNVIVVDWGKLAKPKVSVSADVFYPIVVHNVPRVGEEIGKMLHWMMENDLFEHPDQIHIIGFSLGAHIAGAAGSWFKQKTNRFIGRVTALDPAAPMFEHAVDAEKIDKTDADFVDVIHSSRLGLYDRLGHIDFYVNGGRFQADCYQLSDKTPRDTFSDFYRAIMGSCGHSRAPLYYIYSIKAGAGSISGCGCSSWRDYLSTCKSKCKGIVNFGEFCPHTARGVFFLEITVEDIKA